MNENPTTQTGAVLIDCISHSSDDTLCYDTYQFAQKSPNRGNTFVKLEKSVNFYRLPRDRFINLSTKRFGIGILSL